MRIIKNLFFLLMVLCAKPLFAFDFEVDGIYYNYRSGYSGEVVVAPAPSSNPYSGSVRIPYTVNKNFTTYKVTGIGSKAFRNCTNLTSILIDDNVEYIGTNAFDGCTSLTSVTFGNSIRSIEFEAFARCSALTSIHILSSVNYMGTYAFYGCSGLTNVNIDDLEAWCRISFEGEYSNPCSIAHHLTLNGEEIKSLAIPSTITAIKDYAFVGCSNFTDISFNSSVTSIGEFSFSDCTGLTNVTIPNSVTSIGRSAFYNCSGLTTMTIPNSVTSIGNAAFQRCTSLNILNYNAISCDGFSRTDSDRPFNDLNIKIINIGDGVRTIPNYFVYGLTQLTSITIPSTVSSIGRHAFAYCSSLTELHFNAMSCTDFNSSYLPFTRTFISSIQIGDEVQRIPAYFAKDLTTLRTVTIGNAVNSIGGFAFYGCNCMTELSMGNSVISIESSAFYDCSALKFISLPNSLRTIGKNAFNYCTGLQSVYCFAELPPVMEESNCFNSSTYNSSTLFVPYQSLETYKTTNYWNKFSRAYGLDSEGNILADGISLNATYKNLNVGEYFMLTATVLPGVATNKTVQWSSSDNSVATVNNEGLVTAKKEGNATIKATTTDGTNLSASCEITVLLIPVTSISLNKTSLTLDVNETFRLIASISPIDASYKNVTWTSSNTSVAIVDDDGLVTPVSIGSVTIKASTTDGTNLSASCEVTVLRKVKSITLNESNISLVLPESVQLTVTITPSDATNKSLHWTSSNTDVAAVDSNGYITSVNPGTATITATTTDGSNLSATCQVTVIKQYVTSITLSESKLVMHLGETAQLIADVEPYNASNKVLSWSSGNTSIARVDNNGLVTAISDGTTYIRARATDGSNVYANCTVEVLPDYYITLDTLSHIRGSSTQVVDLPVTLINKNLISGIQFDVSLPNDVSFNFVDGVPDVWLDDARKTRTHSVSVSQLSNGKYRVLVTSSSAKDLKGNDGVLVHMNMLLPQLHNVGNYTIGISNIIASEADETRHALNNTSTSVRFYYIVGDADANAIVDIADHAATASKILGKSPSPFYSDAANVDNNYSLDVVDLVGITNIALELKPITIRQAPIRGGVENRIFCEVLRLNADDEREINLGIVGDFNFAGFQMDLQLPRGLELIEASLGEDTANLGLVTALMPDGKIRLLGTSFSDDEVDGVCPKLLKLRLKADRYYLPGTDIEFSDILFAERNLNSHSFDASCIEYVEPSSVYELIDGIRIYVENSNIIVDTPVEGYVQLIAVDGRIVDEYFVQVGHNVYPTDVEGIYIIHFKDKAIKVRF